ncbi:MAG: PAS domain S-box protein, partial [archaeon]
YSILANRNHNATRRVALEQQNDQLEHLRGELTDIALDFLKHPGRDVDTKVNDALSRIGMLANAHRSYVFQFDGPETTYNSHEWTAPTVEPQIEANQDFSATSLPWLYPRLKAFETVVVPSVADLPREAHEEQEIFRAQNIQSMVVVPMISAGELVGFIGFDWVKKRRELPDSVVDVLEMVGELIANALQFERKQAELRAVNERWSLAQKASNLGVWDWDLRTDDVTFSEGWTTLVGDTQSGIESTIDAWKTRIHPDDLPEVEAALESHFEGEKTFYECDHRMRTADGAWLWTRGVGKVVERDESGQPARAVGIQRDISTHKEREIELAAAKNAYQDLFDGIDDAVFVHEPDGPFLAVNETACDRLGYTESELLERSPVDIDASEDTTPDRIEQIEAAGTHTFEAVHKRKSGEYVPVEIAASIIEYFGETAILSVARDISERTRQTQELRRYKHAIDSSTEMLVAADRDGRILFANERFRTVVGTGKDDLAGRDAKDVLSDELLTEIKPHFERGLEGESGQFERTHPTPEGKTIPLAVNYYPLETPDGDVEGVVAAIRDVTEQKARKRELESQLEEIRRRSEFRRVMSAVNQRLVEFNELESVLEEVVEILASSEEFASAYIYRSGTAPIRSVGGEDAERDDAGIESTRLQALCDAVFEAGTVRIENVTEPPYQLVAEAAGPSEGWGIELSYEDERFGFLAVQLPPGETAREPAVELLEELAGDVGLFLYTQKIETDLRDREERLDLALEAAELGVWDWDMQTDTVYRDERYTRMLGYDPEEIGDTFGAWAAILHPDARETHDRALKEHIDGNAELYECEYRLRTAEDEWKWISNIGKILEWTEDGEPKRSVGVHQDIDEKRRIREQLKSNNELLQAIDRVLRHNLNNHMNIIRGYAQTIAETSTGRLESQAETILESSDDLLGTADKERRITDLVAKGQPTEPVTLGPLLRRIAARVRDRYPEATVVLHGDQEETVLAVPSIDGALEELIENGVVHSHREAPRIEVTTRAGDESVTIEIVDDGPGIPKMERNVLTGHEEITPLYH